MIVIAQVWSDTEFINALETINQNPTSIKHIIFDFLNEVNYVFKKGTELDLIYHRIVQIAHDFNIPLTILTPYCINEPPLLDFSQNKYARINLVQFETFWFNKTYNFWKNAYIRNPNKMDITQLYVNEALDDFKYPYITLNNISKNHRCLFMDMLAKHDMIDSGAIAWRDIRRNCDDVRHTFPEGMTDSMYCGYPYKYWTPKVMLLDQTEQRNLYNQETVPFEYNQSLVQLITESDDTVNFISEKTCTAILLNKPFLVASAVNFHKNLNRFGFVNYDELFDYSFDSETDMELRFEGIAENIKRYKSCDADSLKRIHNKVFDKAIYNKKIAMTYVNSISAELQNIVDLLKKENITDVHGPLNMFL